MSEIIKKLNENIPREDVSTRSAGGNRTLSYLEGWYVINRLNEVLGQGNWQYETVKLEKVFEGSATNSMGKTGRAVSYLATIQLTADVDGKVIQFSDVGAGKGIDYGNGLEADESAAKEAVTDGLKRCAKNLGMSMGLALYDRSQEFVSEEKRQPAKQETPKPQPEKRHEECPNSVETANKRRPESNESGFKASEAKTNPSTERQKQNSDNRPIRELIRTSFDVLRAQNKISAEEFRKKYLDGAKVDQITEAQAEKVLTTLRNDFKEIA